jgi:hypothetical protein
MLSTTVEPECRQRPFVTSYEMAELGSGRAADTVGLRTWIGAAAEVEPAREATKALAHTIIHPAADRVAAHGTAGRTNSIAVSGVA